MSQNSQLEAQLCDFICTAIGIEAFMHTLNKLDPSPIDLCMDAHLCPYAPDASVTSVSTTATPATANAPDGNVALEWDFTINNATGTGIFGVMIEDANQKNPPLGLTQLSMGAEPGNYRMVLNQPQDTQTELPASDYIVQVRLCLSVVACVLFLTLSLSPSLSLSRHHSSSCAPAPARATPRTPSSVRTPHSTP